MGLSNFDGMSVGECEELPEYEAHGRTMDDAKVLCDNESCKACLTKGDICSADSKESSSDNVCKHVPDTISSERVSADNSMMSQVDDYSRYRPYSTSPDSNYYSRERASVNHYATRVEELVLKLSNMEKLNEELRKQLDEAIRQKNIACCQLEVLSASHESRITEMHCIIAELSKKLRAKQDSVIIEENDQDSSDTSNRCGSTSGTEPPVECREAAKLSLEENNDDFIVDNTVPSAQAQALKEDMLYFKYQNAHSQTANVNDPTTETRRQLDNKKSLEQTTLVNVCFGDSKNKTELDDWDLVQNLLPDERKLITEDHIKQRNTYKSPTTVAKVAERVKLRLVQENVTHDVGEIIKEEQYPIENSECLRASIRQSEDIIHGGSAVKNKERLQTMERRIDILQARNAVLALTLNDCKKHCEHLYLLCGKYESNALALQAALNCSDRAIEAYDVMLALLESKMALMKQESAASQESRQVAEIVARHLLERLDTEKNFTDNSLGPWQNTVCISSLQTVEPWSKEDDIRLRNHVSKLKCRRSTIQNTVVNFESPFYSEPEIINPNLEYMPANVQKSSHVDLEVAILTQEILNLREDILTSRQTADSSELSKHIAFEKIRLLQDSLNQLQGHVTECKGVSQKALNRHTE